MGDIMFDSRMTCKAFLALTVALCGLAAKAAEDTRVPFADPYVLYHDGIYYAYGCLICRDSQI